MVWLTIDEFQSSPGHIPKFTWKSRRKSGKTSARMAGVPAEIRTENFLNTYLERYHYISLFGVNNETGGRNVQEQTFWPNLTCYSRRRILNLGHPRCDAGALSARKATLCCMSFLSTQSVVSNNYILSIVYFVSNLNHLKPMHHPF
jgi:hypothetical protein